MTGSHAVKMPTRKDLLVFGLLLPFFCALLGWLAVGGRRGLVVAAAVCAVAAVASLLIQPAPLTKKLRAFAIPLALVALLAIGALGVSATVMAVAGLAIGLIVGLTVIATPLGTPIYVGWLETAEPIGYSISMLVLALAYFGVFAPIGLLMRLFGRDAMTLKYDRSAASYWIEHEAATDSDRYFRQF